MQDASDMDDTVNISVCDYTDVKGSKAARCIHLLAENVRGLGCDVARLIFDAGLQILKTDISIDGTYCLMLFIVDAPSKIQVNWENLGRKLRQVVAHDFSLNRQLNLPMAPEGARACIIVIECENRVGLLHALIESLWEAELHVAQSTTKAGATPNHVRDSFLVYDCRLRLPDPVREREIAAKLQEALPEWRMAVSFDCVAASEPWPAPDQDLRAACVPQLCKDAAPRHNLSHVPCNTEQQAHFCPAQEGQSVFVSKGWGAPDETVVITVDHSISPHCTVVHLACRPRKGLLYDLLRTTHELDVQVDHVTSRLQPESQFCDIQLFVKDSEGRQLQDDRLLQALLLRLRKAVELPVVVSVSEGRDAGTWEVWVFTLPDSGMRGRPRVTYDVTTVLSRAGMQVLSGTVAMINDLQDAELPDTQAADLAVQLSLATPTENELHDLLVQAAKSGTLGAASPLFGSVHAADGLRASPDPGRDGSGEIFSEQSLAPLRALCVNNLARREATTAPSPSPPPPPAMSYHMSEQLSELVGSIALTSPSMRSAFLSQDGGPPDMWTTGPASRHASSRGLLNGAPEGSIQRSLWEALSTKLSLQCALSMPRTASVLEMHHFVVEAGASAFAGHTCPTEALAEEIREELLGQYQH